MVDYNEVGARIRQTRVEQGITQEELAFQINTSAAYISNIERGIKKPSLQKLSDIADIFHVTVNDLIYEKPSNEANPLVEDEIQSLLSLCKPDKQKRLKNNIMDLLQILITD